MGGSGTAGCSEAAHRSVSSWPIKPAGWRSLSRSWTSQRYSAEGRRHSPQANRAASGPVGHSESDSGASRGNQTHEQHETSNSSRELESGSEGIQRFMSATTMTRATSRLRGDVPEGIGHETLVDADSWWPGFAGPSDSSGRGRTHGPIGIRRRTPAWISGGSLRDQSPINPGRVGRAPAAAGGRCLRHPRRGPCDDPGAGAADG